MKVKVVETFFDRQDQKLRESNSVFECEKKRGEYLIERGLVEETKEQKQLAKKPEK